jgi:hypothetical protein
MEMTVDRTVRLQIDEIGTSGLLDKCRNSSTIGEDVDLPQPVWLKKDPGDGLSVLWTPRLMSDSPMECLVIDDDRSGWLLTLAIWNRYGGPGPVETGRIINYLDEEIGDTPRLFAQGLDILGLPNSPEILDGYRSLVGLPDPLQEELRQENLSPRLFRYLQRVPESLKSPIVELLSEHPRVFSVQEMRQLADALRRIPRSRYDRFSEQLESFRDEKDDPSEYDASTIIDFTRKLAYPEITSREDNFIEDLNSLDLDGRITVRPPKNFEGDYLEFSFRCSRGDDLEALAEEVKRCRTLLDHV